MRMKMHVRGLVKTPLFIHVYTRGCQIYSQLAISETPSLTYYLQYTRIPCCRHIHSCEVLSTPHSHSYNAANLLGKLTLEIKENAIDIDEVIHIVGQDDNDC